MRKFSIIFLFIGIQSFGLHLFGQMYKSGEVHGDSVYSNPVIPADFSDLDVIRVGNDFYAISSTMQYSPGMVVIHSKDLVNWEIVGHIVDDLTKISPEMNWDKMNCYGSGIWAGSIRYYKNKYWVYFGTPDDGFFMSSAVNPAGPWEPLHQLWKVKGWDDCCSFCDDGGQLYFIATNFAYDPETNKKYNIHLFKMTSDGRSLLMETDTIIHQSNGSEANKLYKINGLYYHFFSQVNQRGERLIMMERSDDLYGRWEIKQLNRVNIDKDREPNQGGLLRLDDDKWFFLTHHGHGDWEGRPTSLLPVTWINGWPIIGKVAADTIGEMVWFHKKPITVKEKLFIQGSDEFDFDKLNVQWEWNYQPRNEKWSLTEKPGSLRLHAFKPINPDDKKRIILRAGNTVTQRSMRTEKNVVTMKMNIRNMSNGQIAGLTHLSTGNYSLFGVKQMEGSKKLIYVFNDDENIGFTIKQKNIWLQSQWDINGKNKYLYSLDGRKFIPFPNETQLTWGSYRGDRIGIFNFNSTDDKGFVDIDWFKYDYSK